MWSNLGIGSCHAPFHNVLTWSVWRCHLRAETSSVLAQVTCGNAKEGGIK